MISLLRRIHATGKPVAHLARRAGVTRAALSNVAHGRRMFSAPTLARVLGVLAEEERRIEREQADLMAGRALRLVREAGAPRLAAVLVETHGGTL